MTSLYACVCGNGNIIFAAPLERGLLTQEPEAYCNGILFSATEGCSSAVKSSCTKQRLILLGVPCGSSYLLSSQPSAISVSYIALESRLTKNQPQLYRLGALEMKRKCTTSCNYQNISCIPHSYEFLIWTDHFVGNSCLVVFAPNRVPCTWHAALFIGLGYEKMVCALCLSIFWWRLIVFWCLSPIQSSSVAGINRWYWTCVTYEIPPESWFIIKVPG